MPVRLAVLVWLNLQRARTRSLRREGLRLAVSIHPVVFGEKVRGESQAVARRRGSEGRQVAHECDAHDPPHEGRVAEASCPETARHSVRWL